MAYTPKEWADGAAGGTPITAAELNRMEAGIGDAHDAIDALPEPLELGTTADTAAPGDHTHSPASIGAAAASHTHTLSQITDAGDAAGMDVGTTSGTVAAGDHTHTGLTADAAAGTASLRTLGTGATQAAAGNHAHTAAQVTATAVGAGTATDVQGILAELDARITALEETLQ